MVSAALGGAFLAGRTETSMGPFEAGVSLRPSFTGDTLVRIGPLGTLTLDTHDGPFGITIDAREIRLEDAKSFVERPEAIGQVGDDAAEDAAGAIRTVALRAVAGALAAAIGVMLLRRPGLKRAAVAGLAGMVTVAAGGAAARLTWDPTALAEPRYSGLLAVAPQAVGSLSDVQARFQKYSAQLSRLIGNLATIYNTISDLPVLADQADTVRLLQVSDIHLNPAAFDVVSELVEQFEVDAVLDTGDINDWGTTVEGRFVEDIADLGVPYLFVRGNHDSAVTAAAVAAQPNAIVLDDDVTSIEGIRIWGIGDPRFTPDKSTAVSIEEERDQARAFAPEVARRVDRVAPVDIVMVHDPRTTGRLGGIVPLVLAGHLHKQSSSDLSDDTLLLVEGSTGGAGLRGLESGRPVPLSATVLHLAKSDGRLIAFDRITVGGLGRTGARIQRYVRPPPAEEPESTTATTGTTEVTGTTATTATAAVPGRGAGDR